MARGDDFYVGEDDEQEFEADHGYDLSMDGARLRRRLLNLEHVEREPTATKHAPVGKDIFSDWTPVDGEDWGGSGAIADTVSTLVWEVDESDGRKRGRYDSSDNPNLLWRPLIPFYIDEMIRRDGLGDYTNRAQCIFCDTVFEKSCSRMFRCEDCGEFLQCESCVRERHVLTPLHVLKEWTGDFWTEAWLHRSTSSTGDGLGMVYQLGHHGRPCPLPEALKRRMVVLDIRGVFILTVQFCGCTKAFHQEHSNLTQLLGNGWYPATTVSPATCATYRALEQFRLLGVVGNMNAHDFVGAMECSSDPTRIGTTPDRYKAFGRMARQFNYAKRLKRAGRGHELSGVLGTGPGELAVACWACPAPGFNLPDGWDRRPEGERFLDAIALAMDANFRLKNHIRGNERYDPSFGPGLGYFVEGEAYKKHLRNYVGEQDISSCIAFAALTQKDTRLTTGLYANMDYILLSALRYASVKKLVISYDIVCQWMIHLAERARRIATETPITTNLDQFELDFGLPVWHAIVHEASCQAENSLSFVKGVGRTDGEGIERTWALLNPVAFATKEMGEGNRHDTIEDKIDHINFEKNIQQGEALSRKLIVAISERDKQISEFEEMDGSLNDETRLKWQTQVTDWGRDKSKPNPYLMQNGKKAGPSEAQVLAELRKTELAEQQEGRARIGEGKMTAGGFIKAKLQLENLQRRIEAESKAKTLTADRASQLDELRVSFFKKLRTIQKLEDVFQPGVDQLRSEEEDLRDPDMPAPKAEDVKLWLPSDMSSDELEEACVPGLGSVESQLRRGQCGDALASLCARIHAKTHLILFRNAQVVGQRQGTRSSTMIGRMAERQKRDAAKYRRAYRALVALEGLSFAPEFKELKEEDMNDRTEQESDAAARASLGRGGGRRVRTEPSLARKATSVSWIWFIGGDVDAGEIHDAVRVQWSKALARRDRWREEVLIIREEMKRVLRALVTTQATWRARSSMRSVADPGLASGLRAYALRQATIHKQIADAFYKAWDVSPAEAVQSVVRQDGAVYRTLLDSGDGAAPS
ncbi:hypothetical protein C8F01DRAFT_1254013 [Mycena amicta]|nr:hypothetical protein C8F01DRAFT_1254013 [Mycena amicta]